VHTPSLTEAREDSCEFSLQYAFKCLRNCLYLVSFVIERDYEAAMSSQGKSKQELSENRNGKLPNNNNKLESKDPSVINTVSTSTPTTPIITSITTSTSSDSVSSSTHTQKTTSDNLFISEQLRNSTLLNLSYVLLGLDHPTGALKYALELLEHKSLSIDQRFLAHNYAAEALCMMNQPSEAITHSNPNLLEDFLSQSEAKQPTAARRLNSMFVHPASSVTTHGQQQQQQQRRLSRVEEASPQSEANRIRASFFPFTHFITPSYTSLVTLD
jgi:hypothetical protein